MTKEMIAQRLTALREVLQREHLAAFVFPARHPQLSTNQIEHWNGCAYVSGFTGSDGTAVVTQTCAALWTDSRFFSEAEQQLAGTEYVLMKETVAGTPTVAEWIEEQCTKSHAGCTSSEVGVDGMTCSAAMVEALIKDLRRHGGFTLRTNFDPLRVIWKDRPALPSAPVVLQPLACSCETIPSKLKRIRHALRDVHADGMLMCNLDDIAWTLNLRGSDADGSSVFISYLLISTTSVTLYVNKDKLSEEVKAMLYDSHIVVEAYDRVRQGLTDYFEQTILLNPEEVCYTLYKVVKRDIISLPSPVPALKK